MQWGPQKHAHVSTLFGSGLYDWYTWDGQLSYLTRGVVLRECDYLQRPSLRGVFL